MARVTFVLGGIEYFAVRGPGEIVLITRVRIKQAQYDEAFAFAKKLFRAMEECLAHSMEKTSESLGKNSSANR